MHPTYMVKDGEEYKFIKNEQGSIRFVMKVSDGTILQEMRYDEFGRITYDSNPGFQPFGFASGMYDHTTGLIFDNARDVRYSENAADAGDFAINYFDMRNANTRGSSDKYFHCLANCQASSRGASGRRTSEILSNFREFLDQLPPKSDSDAACAADQVANQRGRDTAGGNCKSSCSVYAPRGLPASYR